MDDFDLQIQKEINIYLESIKDDIAKILEDCIDKDLYQYYQSTEYQRTMQLRDSVTYQVNMNGAFPNANSTDDIIQAFKNLPHMIRQMSS